MKSQIHVQKSPKAFVWNSAATSMEQFHHHFCDLQLRLLICATALLTRWNHDNLAAPYWRFYMIIGKGAHVRWRGQTIPLDPHYGWLIGPDTEFGTTLEHSVTQHYVHFTLTPGLSSEQGVFSIKITPTMRMLHKRALARSFASTDESSRTNKSARVGVCFEQSVLAWNTIVLHALAGLPSGALRERRIDARVLRVLDCMESDLAKPHTLEAFARVSGMHPRALIRLFRQETGATPMASLRARRIATACDLLHHSRHTIDDIAQRTGFCDRYHFSKVFQQLRELSPAVFRQLQRDQK